jgi:hypothetical protein
VAVLAPPPAALVHSLPLDGGRFSWDVARGEASWSDSVYRLHGYQPGEVSPSTALTFRHKHPDDLYECVDALHAGMLANLLIVHEHRVVDVTGQVRPVVMVARERRSEDGAVRTVHGMLLPADGAPGAAGDPAIATVRAAFGVSEAAARVLVAAGRPLPAWRWPREQGPEGQHQGAARSSMPRVLGTELFPMEHLDGRSALEPAA